MSYKEESACETPKQQQERYMRQSSLGSLGGSIGGIGAKSLTKSAADRIIDHLTTTVSRARAIESRYGEKFQEFMFPSNQPPIPQEIRTSSEMPSYFLHIEGDLNQIDDVLEALDSMMSRTGI